MHVRQGNSIISLLALFCLVGGPALAGNGLGIKGSKHDFSAASWAPVGGDGEICRFCHAPHDKGRVRYQNGLLWNHAVSQANYTMYDSAWSETIDGTGSAGPDGYSKLCLACHDGTVALDSYDMYSGATYMADENSSRVTGRATGGGNIDLHGSHPISITYDAVLDTGLYDPTVATWADGSTVASTLQNNKVQCSTCHDVHNNQSVPATMVLRTGNQVGRGGPSALCLTCHNK